MAREWLNWPSNIPLETKLGKIYLSATSGSHIYATTHPGDGIPAEYLTVNSVMLNVSIHVSKYTDGKGRHRLLTHPDIPEPPLKEAYWNLSPGSNGFPSHTSLHATKAHWVKYSDSDASSAARKKIEDVVVPAIIAWIEAHPETMAKGEAADRNNDASRIEGEIEELETKLAEKKAELKKVLAA